MKLNFVKLLIYFFFLLNLFTVSLGFANSTKSFIIMAPLWMESPSQWANFKSQLQEFKKRGVTAISTDVWWGVVEPEDQKFDFTYYDKLSDEIIHAGLKWMPILSTHQCGGNVGDECSIPLPSWIWKKYIGLDSRIKNENSLKYKSEQGHFSSEVISAWGSEIILSDYINLYEAFKNHFQNKMNSIIEINISLGPAGELRYPSYNSHDQGSGYPSRGSLQAYSDLAVDQFRKFIQTKYKNNLALLNQAWGTFNTIVNTNNITDWTQIYPPTDFLAQPPELFFKNNQHFSKYGSDFFEWYHFSLTQHAKLILTVAHQVFKNSEIGAKVPGIHWRMASDRLAELAAGLINTNDQMAFLLTEDHKSPRRLGYDNIFQVFSDQKTILHFTCLEMENFENQYNKADSLAETLVYLVGSESQKWNILLKGENALSDSLSREVAWNQLRKALTYSSYQGLTLLRMNSFNSYSYDQLQNLINVFHTNH